MIYTVSTYTDDEGKTIMVKAPFASENEPEITKGFIYEGVFSFQTPMGTFRATFEFEGIDAPPSKAINQCFAKFEELAQAKVEQMEKEIQNKMMEHQRQLSVPNRNIAVPMGKNDGGIIIP